MRFAVAVAPFAGLAAGFAIVDPQVFESIPVTPAKHHHDCHESSWWESHIRSAEFEAIAAAVASEPDSGDGQALKSIGHTLDELLLSKEEGDVVTVSSDGPRHDDGSSSSTIYEIISKSNYTTRFAELVYDFPELVQLLNSTEANYTVFVPTNSAFEHIPDDGKKPSKEFVENVLKYHIGVGLYPAKRFIFTHTIPSVLEESLLGGNPQRLRTSFSLLRGARVNLFTKVVYADVFASNGVIHGVDKILVPPSMVGRELTLLPNIFSTLLLAYEKTDFVSFIHHVAMNGSTVFAPTNEAFARLGPRANAFLFNTEPGKKYLTALLKYQIVTNTTLYSDAIYSATETETEVVNRPGSRDVKAKETYLVTLPTLLDGKDVLVRVSGWGPTRHITVNGVVDVVVMDVVAKNGVIQVVGSVPIPPHPHKGDFVGGEIEVEDLKERLDVFVGETTPEFSVEL